MDEQGMTVDGYRFSDPAEYKKATSEKKAVDYLQSQIDMDKPEAVLAIYSQIIGQDVFHTAVGLDFLKGLQKFLMMHEAIDNSRIPGIPVVEAAKPAQRSGTADGAAKPTGGQARPSANDPAGAAENVSKKPGQAASSGTQPPKGTKQKKDGKQKKHAASAAQDAAQGDVWQRRFRLSLFVNVVLLLVIVAMFALSATSNMPTILDYKTKLEDNYASWEQNLTEREKALNEWESDLQRAQVEWDMTQAQDGDVSEPERGERTVDGTGQTEQMAEDDADGQTEQTVEDGEPEDIGGIGEDVRSDR